VAKALETETDVTAYWSLVHLMGGWIDRMPDSTSGRCDDCGRDDVWSWNLGDRAVCFAHYTLRRRAVVAN
jgi:hypothetical protein